MLNGLFTLTTNNKNFRGERFYLPMLSTLFFVDNLFTLLVCKASTLVAKIKFHVTNCNKKLFSEVIGSWLTLARNSDPFFCLKVQSSFQVFEPVVVFNSFCSLVRPLTVLFGSPFSPPVFRLSHFNRLVSLSACCKCYNTTSLIFTFLESA